MKLNYIIKRILKTALGVVISIKNVPWFSFFKFYDKDAEVVLWIYVFGYQYPIDCMLRDLTVIRILLEREKKFKIKIGREVGKLAGKKIIYNPARKYDLYGFKNHCSIIAHISSELEKQNNKVMPSYYDLLFWENKEFMHAKFEELGIRTPQSFIIKKKSDLDKISLEFPILLKDTNAHHSMGLFKVDSLKAAKDKFDEYYQLKPGNVFIAQELIEMRRDLRVILIGDEIFLHYWRVNHEKEWKPTSTSHGTRVDFYTFPEKWRAYIIENFKKLNMLTGAFDITWQNDDLETEPYFLEISPLYGANPIFDPSIYNLTYGQWTKSFRFKDSYEEKYADIIYQYLGKKIDVFLSE